METIFNNKCENCYISFVYRLGPSTIQKSYENGMLAKH